MPEPEPEPPQEEEPVIYPTSHPTMPGPQSFTPGDMPEHLDIF